MTNWSDLVGFFSEVLQIVSKKRQLQSVDKSISDMEKQLELLQAKRNRLSKQVASSQSRSRGKIRGFLSRYTAFRSLFFQIFCWSDFLKKIVGHPVGYRCTEIDFRSRLRVASFQVTQDVHLT